MTLCAPSDVLTPKALPSLLRELNVVAVALLTRDGALQDANTGFLRMIPGEHSESALRDVRDLFVHPRFDQFAARQAEPSDSSVYRGILNIGDMNVQVRSLRGTIYALGDDLLVVAEHDIAQLEKNVATLGMLNEELNTSRREIARLERKSDRQHDEAQGALADREVLLAMLSQSPSGDV